MLDIFDLEDGIVVVLFELLTLALGLVVLEFEKLPDFIVDDDFVVGFTVVLVILDLLDVLVFGVEDLKLPDLKLLLELLAELE